MKGFNLHNNAQVPIGSNVTVDISSIPASGAVICQLSLNDEWNEVVTICATTPLQYDCTGQYNGRSSFFNDTTLLITGVLKNESGIYRCRRIGVVTEVIIPGVIIVGMDLFYSVILSMSKFKI